MKTRLLALPALLVLLAGCPPADEPGSVDGLIHAEWEEDDDSGNNNPGNPEQVDVEWTGSVTIHGEADGCDYNYDAEPNEWPWTGDEDYYEVEVPADGYLDATLTWDNSSELDMHIYFELPTGMTVSPDEMLYAEDDSTELEFLFPNENEEGDEVMVVMLCRSGGGGAYDLKVGWDD